MSGNSFDFGSLHFTNARFTNLIISGLHSRGTKVQILRDGFISTAPWSNKRRRRYYRNRVLAWPLDRLVAWLTRIRPDTSTQSTMIVNCIRDGRDE